MKPAPFDYFRPASLADVFYLLDRHGDRARLIAGGQSLVPMMNLRMARPAVLIDLATVQDLSGIRADAAHVHIGAMTRQNELLTNELIKRHVPLLPLAVAYIGHFQTRCRGTVGGSLAHADPSAELSVAMVTLNATFSLGSKRGERQVPARDFFVDALTTAMQDDEVLKEIRVPVCPADAKVAFREFARRHGDFAIASAAVQRSAGAKLLQAGLGAVGVAPHFCSELSTVLATNDFDVSHAERLIAREIERIDAISDLNAGGDYRRRIASILLLECVQEVFSA